jgi:L-histidine Nalpha-methyltransferase
MASTSLAARPAVAERFTIERRFDAARDSTIARDVRLGLARRVKAIPPKHFYDARGSELFDRICELPEYYLTRTEHALLEAYGADVVAATGPTDVIELGSGAARKTRTLLEAAARGGGRVRYHPMDVCEPMLRTSAARLLAEHPWLEVHAVVADYDRHLAPLPAGRRRLVAFLGSTIGNYGPRRAETFLRRVAAELRRGEHLLLGADLVKPVARLEAAYDDAAGVTAAFNRNVLSVINRELGADFRPEGFDHVASFDRRRSQIDMFLRARRAQVASIPALGMTVRIRAGETIHTEISRKFTERRLETLLRRAGFEIVRWYLPADRSFALVLAER